MAAIEFTQGFEEGFGPAGRSSTSEEVAVVFRAGLAFRARWGWTFRVAVESILGWEEAVYPFSDGTLFAWCERCKHSREAFPLDSVGCGTVLSVPSKSVPPSPPPTVPSPSPTATPSPHGTPSSGPTIPNPWLTPNANPAPFNPTPTLSCPLNPWEVRIKQSPVLNPFPLPSTSHPAPILPYPPSPVLFLC